MPIYDTFTKRKRREAEAGKPQPLLHDKVPEALRRQIVFIWKDALGFYVKPHPYEFSGERPANARWRLICEILCRERGVFSLTSRTADDPNTQCVNLLLTGDTDDALEVIEASFKYIDVVMRKVPDWQRGDEGLSQDADEAIAELNGRLQEHRVGYRYENGRLVRIDSELLHREVTQPALRLLNEEGFEGALEEFLSAHDHHRKGETKDANVDALNALESTLKTICEKRRWKAKGATGADLIKLVVSKGLIPAELQGQFEHLIKAMQTGLPPVRHNFGGHGQGSESKVVADHLANYSLHLMGANIVLLIEAHRALR